jgi:phosphatidylserine decarboxylase
MPDSADPIDAPVPLRWTLFLQILSRLPQGLLSRMTGWFADLPLPASLRGPIIGAFARWAGVDLAEAEHPPKAYPSVGDYFVRRLRPGVRPWPEDSGQLASPVDGVVGAVGIIRSHQLIQAKGMPYTLEDLLTADSGALRRSGLDPSVFEGGWFITLYLSPRHYHRIHVPADGQILSAESIPGSLFPVNLPALRTVPRLFPRNERLVVWMDVGRAPLALVAVGAFNVGRISVDFDPEWNGGGRRAGGRGVTNLPRQAGAGFRAYHPPRPSRQGEGLAAFHLGSTVVLLRGADPAGTLPDLHPAVQSGREIRLGDPLLLRSTGPGPATSPGS